MHDHPAVMEYLHFKGNFNTFLSKSEHGDYIATVCETVWLKFVSILPPEWQLPLSPVLLVISQKAALKKHSSCLHPLLTIFKFRQIHFSVWINTFNNFSSIFFTSLQSGASSRSKIGGAFFSDVSGSIQDPIAVPGPCEVTEF